MNIKFDSFWKAELSLSSSEILPFWVHRVLFSYILSLCPSVTPKGIIQGRNPGYLSM